MTAYPLANSRLLSAANSDNATVVKAKPARLMTLKGVNHAAATRFIKFYNKATAPVVGDTPVETIELPASAAFNFDWTSNGSQYPLGLGYRITVLAPDADATAVTAGDITAMNVGFW